MGGLYNRVWIWYNGFNESDPFMQDAKGRKMPKVATNLLASRKFWLAIVGVVTAIVSYYADVPPEVWAPIEVLMVTMIGSIAVEDAALKLGSGKKPNE